eukprot:11228409-Prorocentrum_lima.AAC.1
MCIRDRPSSASVVESGSRRVRSRPPADRDVARPPSEGAVEAQYVELLREEAALKTRLARVAQQKRGLE